MTLNACVQSDIKMMKVIKGVMSMPMITATVTVFML